MNWCIVLILSLNQGRDWHDAIVLLHDALDSELKSWACFVCSCKTSLGLSARQFVASGQIKHLNQIFLSASRVDASLTWNWTWKSYERRCCFFGTHTQKRSSLRSNLLQFNLVNARVSHIFIYFFLPFISIANELMCVWLFFLCIFLILRLLTSLSFTIAKFLFSLSSDIEFS